MILELATAEIGNRIRRAFGLRGRITTSVDETAFLAAQIADLDAPPFRTDGLRWMGRLTQAAVAANNSWVVVGYSGTAGAATVDAIIVNNQAGAASSFVLDTVANAGAPPVGGCSTTEVPPVAPATVADTPVGIAAGFSVLAAAGFLRVTLPVGGSILIPDLQLVLQPGVNLRLYGAAVNTDVSVTFMGRYWNSIGS